VYHLLFSNLETKKQSGIPFLCRYSMLEVCFKYVLRGKGEINDIADGLLEEEKTLQGRGERQ
jgi:hypothetical protein